MSLGRQSVAGVDNVRRFTREEVDRLIANHDWFPFVEEWSTLSASHMFESLIASSYGGGLLTIPMMTIRFSRESFKHAIPDHMCFPIPLLALSGGGRVIVTHDIDNKDYRDMNAVGEFYTEDLRLTSSKRKFMTLTPIEMWDRERPRIVELARTKDGPNAGPYEIRNAVFSFTKESNPFRPTIALAIYSMMNVKTILDMSSGWGDRLIGAMAWARRSGQSGIRYQGYDPFASLQTRYSAMINDFGGDSPEEKGRFVVTCSPFEESPIETDTFDLAFTSPPYFDFEEYGLNSDYSRLTEDQVFQTTRSGQSIVRYPKEKSWIDGFLKPTMVRASQSLRVGGHLAMNIEGTFMNGLLASSMTDTALFGKTTPVRMEYIGIIGYHSNNPVDRYTHPTFVWRRTM